MDLQSWGKWLVALGLLLVAVGVGVWLAGKTGTPLGRLPGDFHWKGENWRVSFPLASGLLLSVVITVLLNLLVWGLGRKNRQGGNAPPAPPAQGALRDRE